MEFVTHRREDGSFQPLREHMENVARLAAEYGAAFGAEEQAGRAGLLHDIGKYSPRGQARQRDPEHTPKTDHATAGAQEAYLKLRDLPAGLAVAGHHGGLPDLGQRGDRENGTFMARMRKELTGENDPSAWRGEIALPQRVKGPAWFGAVREPRIWAMYTRMLFSCLVDADFIDTETAMQGAQPRGGYESIETLLEKLRAQVAPWLEKPKNALCARRSEILAHCLQGGEAERGLYTLTVPTGGGKTVSSLAFALTHAAAHNMRRVIYVIPYTSIIEQNAKVFEKILGAENVLQHHSQADFSDDAQGAEEPAALRKRLACENWDAPVIVTTAVQFFESLYAAKTSRCRKLHNIANSVIIFDEAQTMPLPYLKPCVFAIAELVRHYGATAVLCTATQPALSRFFSRTAPEPAIREIAPDPDGLFDFFRRVTLRQEGEKTAAALAEQIAGQKAALCVVGTRRRARELYELLPEEGRYHLSTLMTPRDRERTLDEIRARLRAGETCRVVSTSLIEAGVDVDFPTVWREIAGLDSILQAAGRCNREGKRSADESVVHIYTPDGSIPKAFQQQVEAAQGVLAKYEDPNTRAAIAAYFKALFWMRGDDALDSKNVLQYEDSLAFRKTEEAFEIILKETMTVYIPTNENANDLRLLRQGLFSRALMRRLGRDAVNLYRYEYDALASAGVLEDYRSDGFAILLDSQQYLPDVGLNVKEPESGAGIFI